MIFPEKDNKFKNLWKTNYFFISKLISNAFAECVKNPNEITSTPVLLYSKIFFSLMFPEASNNMILLLCLSSFLFFNFSLGLLLILSILFMFFIVSLIIEASILSNMIANSFFDFKL